MATPRKPKPEAKINPITVATLALKQVKTRSNYNQIVAANTSETLEAALNQLSEEERKHISLLCDRTPEADLQSVADKITICDNILQLQALKAHHGEEAIKAAWKLLPVEERRRLKSICDGQPAEETPAPVTEQPASYQVEHQPANKPNRTLFTISDDLEKLNELLDECGDDAQQQELINQWLEQLGDERDRKLDNYAALISEMLARAEVRKAEAHRMMELAAVDENRAKLLKQRLMWFFQTHSLKSIDTPRYRLSLQRNGGKAPLILKDGLSPTELPEHFQLVSIDANTTAIREALERGEHLDFAALGERGSSIRIK